ncbi:MAG: hypothetical protein NW206_19825 [Hyphomonadaceae bacterium]|nr:hypothetical protein [Hyphomonadaceae bacterium]
MIALPRPLIYLAALAAMVGAAYAYGRVTGWDRGVAHERELTQRAIDAALAKRDAAQAQINADALALGERSHTADANTRRAFEAGASEIRNVPRRDFAALNAAITNAALGVWRAAGIEPTSASGADPGPPVAPRLPGALAA